MTHPADPDRADSAPRSEPVAGLAVPVDRAVAEDLEAIFPSEAAAPARQGRLRLRRRPRAAGGKRSRERRAASLGALLAAACVGVSAGALIARPGLSTKGAPPPESPGAPITFTPGPLAGAPAPLAPLPARPPQSAAPQAEAAAALEPPAAPPLAAAPQEASADAQTPTAAPPARVRRVAAANRGRSRRLTEAHVGCGRHVRCSAESLKLADARLRRAYGSAERAGVARPVLADYRDEWSRLRRRAPHQPGLVAARYRHMAGDLDHLAARERTVRATPPRVGPWRRFRTQLASLWR